MQKIYLKWVILQHNLQIHLRMFYLRFIKLIDQQRELILARKDLATRLKASVRKPVVVLEGSEDINKLPKNLQATELQGQQQPQLPEEMVSQEQIKDAEAFIMADESTE